MQPVPTLNALTDPLLQLADAMPQLVWITDAGGEVIYFNSRVQEYGGSHRRTDGIWEWKDMVHPDDQPVTAAAWAESLSTETPYEHQHRMRMADGHYYWHLARALPQRDAIGRITHWYGTSTNIHQQKMAEQTLRESEERFRLLTNSIPQIVWIVDGEGNTEYVNDRWNSYTGQDPMAVERDGRMSMIHPDDVALVLDTWALALKQGTPASWEYRLRNTKTDRYRWFLAHVLPLRNDSGTVVKWICAASDIQDHKDNTGQLEHEVAVRTRALERSNEDLQQFAHVASHDLKEPLRKIRTFLSRVLQEYGTQLPGHSAEYLAKIDTSARRMSQMIDGVLHYSILDNEEEPQPEQVALTSVLRNVEADLELLIQSTGAVVKLGVLPSVTGIPVLLHQLFHNLLHNALKFTRPGVPPRISITAEAAPTALREGLSPNRPYVAIRVADNGIGFDPDHARNIFKTFTRLHSKDAFEGTGLGLALCQKIASRHDGAIHADGKPNEGAVFTVVLPLDM